MSKKKKVIISGVAAFLAALATLAVINFVTGFVPSLIATLAASATVGLLTYFKWADKVQDELKHGNQPSPSDSSSS